MGIAYFIVPLETAGYNPITWDMLSVITREQFEQFLKDSPMPKSVVYRDPEELWDDIKKADGTITISENETAEFKEWFLELIYLAF